jgi:hypothetical protein
MGNRNTASSLMISMGDSVASRGFREFSCVSGAEEARFGRGWTNMKELRGADGDAAYDGSTGLSSFT